MKPIVFAPVARDEFEAAAAWYESRSAGLGARFVECIEHVVLQIREAPAGFPEWDHDSRFRKAIAQRFPYVVFYRAQPESIEIIAVAHGAREPGYWLQRS